MSHRPGIVTQEPDLFVYIYTLFNHYSIYTYYPDSPGIVNQEQRSIRSIYIVNVFHFNLLKGSFSYDVRVRMSAVVVKTTIYLSCD